MASAISNFSPPSPTSSTGPGHSCPSYLNSFESIATASQIVIVGPRGNPRTQELIRTVWGKVLPNRLLYVVESGEALPAHHPAFGKGMLNGAPDRLSLPARYLLAADHQRGRAQPGFDFAAQGRGQRLISPHPPEVFAGVPHRHA